MSTSTSPILQYSRRWSRKDLRAISSIALSTSGNWLSAAQNSSLLVFYADNGDFAIDIECPAAVGAMLWISDTVLVCSTAGGMIMTISLLQHECLLLIEGTVSSGHRIEEMVVSHSNAYLATGCGCDIRVWRGRSSNGTWEGLQRLAGPPTSHANASSDVAITALHWLEPEAERRTKPSIPSQLIVSYRNHGIQVWDVTSGRIVHTILNTSVSIGRTALSPDASHLAVVLSGGIDMIDVPSRTQERLADPKCDIECPIAFIHDGGVVISRYGRSEAQLWTLTGEKLQSVEHSSVAQLRCIAAYSNDSTGLFRIATASSTKLVLWQPANTSRGRRSIKDRVTQVTGLLAVWITEGVVWVLISALVIFVMAIAAGHVSVLFN